MTNGFLSASQRYVYQSLIFSWSNITSQHLNSLSTANVPVARVIPLLSDVAHSVLGDNVVESYMVQVCGMVLLCHYSSSSFRSCCHTISYGCYLTIYLRQLLTENNICVLIILNTIISVKYTLCVGSIYLMGGASV